MDSIVLLNAFQYVSSSKFGFFLHISSTLCANFGNSHVSQASSHLISLFSKSLYHCIKISVSLYLFFISFTFLLNWLHSSNNSRSDILIHASLLSCNIVSISQFSHCSSYSFPHCINSQYSFIKASSLKSFTLIFTILARFLALFTQSYSWFWNMSLFSLEILSQVASNTRTLMAVRRAGVRGFQESHPLDLILQKFCIILAHFNLLTPFTWLFAPFLSGPGTILVNQFLPPGFCPQVERGAKTVGPQHWF